jgi:hypothetical protein
MCPHQPACPTGYDTDAGCARVVVARPEQGWSLLCNGVVAFDDGGLLLPADRTTETHCGEPAPHIAGAPFPRMTQTTPRHETGVGLGRIT